MLLFIKAITIFGFSNSLISYVSKSRFYVVLRLQKPYSLRLKKESKLFLPPAKSFASGIIMYTLKETFHRITPLPRSKLITNEFELKLKNLGIKVRSLWIVETCYFKFLDFLLRIFSKYLFDYSKVFNWVIFYEYPLDAS